MHARYISRANLWVCPSKTIVQRSARASARRLKRGELGNVMLTLLLNNANGNFAQHSLEEVGAGRASSKRIDHSEWDRLP